MLKIALIFLILAAPGDAAAHSVAQAIQDSPFAHEVRQGRLFCASRGATNEYDGLYRAAVHKYYPPRFNDSREWCWMKCKAITESGQSPEAVSPVGAMGVMQIMPGTFGDFATRYGWAPDDRTTRTNILMAAAISSAYFKFWITDRAKPEHRRWQQGSYNGGPGRLMEAQVKADGSIYWTDIAPYLPTETAHYVPKIEQCHARLTK